MSAPENFTTAPQGAAVALSSSGYSPYRAVFDQAAVGMAIATLDGRFLETNRGLQEIVGYTAAELQGKSVAEITFSEDRPKTLDALQRVRRGEASGFNLEKRYVHKSGAVKWVRSTVTLLKDENGCPDRFVGVVEDIGKRKRAEELERDNSERLQLALSAGQLGDWSWDAQTDLVTFGPETARIFGLRPGERLTWTRMREQLHPEDREPARLAVEAAVAHRSDYEIEYRLLRGEKYTWVAARGRNTYSAAGNITGMIGVVHDITETKSSQEVFSRLAAVVESSDDAIISMSLDTTIITWNLGAERIFGYTAAEAIGQSVSMLIPPHSDDEEPVILRRLLEGERIDHYETIRMHKDGRLLNVSLTVSPIYDGAGTIVGVSKISRDFTERKRVEGELRYAQEELRRHAEKLEEEVAERTARLRETIQELEAFSYSVSHDLRSPLRAMQGYADALLDDFGPSLDPEAKDFLVRIHRAAARMDLLIQDVLAYSRVAKGDISLRTVNVETVVGDVMQNYPALQPDRARITVVSPIPPVLGHEAYLTQIFSNLLGNAVKFVESGQKPEITIRGTEEANHMVRISVQDKGIGIAPEHQNQIFQIFGRVYSEKKYEGTGIGLAIAKKAAERMGGSVGVHSQLGLGSEFFVLLKKA